MSDEEDKTRHLIILSTVIPCILKMDNVKRSRALLEENFGDDSKKQTPEDIVSVVSDLVKDANECISFRLVANNGESLVGTSANGDDEEAGTTFGPLMSHQLYGDDETIEGYVNPWIKVYLSPLFLPCVVVGYDKKVLEEKATDLIKPMKEAFSGCSLQHTLDEFSKVMNDEGGVMDAPGELVLTKDLGGKETLEIWKSNLSTASPFVKMVHSRMEPLLLFFIDAASAIDANDPSWEFLLCTIRDGKRVRIAGMSTIYSFYVYPDRKRYRLSQAFVLPPEQGKGIGSAIVQAVFDLAKQAGVVDVTLEDPTDDFRRLRDRKDLRDMLALDWITSEAKQKLQSLGKQKNESKEDDSDVSPLSPYPDTLKRLCKDLMMNKKQAERMWESLLFKIAADTMTPDKVVAVEGYISKTLEDSFVSGAKDGSENKVVEDTQTGFIMYKSKSKVQMVPGNLPPVEDITSEQQQSMIADYVATRVEEIKTLVGAPQ